MLAQQQQQAQQEEFMRQQMAMQEQQRQQEEWARQQFLAQQQQSLLAQPTGYGSNNPFAPGGGLSAQQTSTPQPATSSFLPVPVVSQQAPSPQPQQQQQQQRPIEPQQTAKPFQAAPPKDDGDHAGLAALLARGREDGLDTFGNVGALRECLVSLSRNDVSSLTCLPPGIPVGSAFHQSNRMAVQQTGAGGFGANNPFGQPQQQKQVDQPFFSV
jgi:epsin